MECCRQHASQRTPLENLTPSVEVEEKALVT